MTTHTISILNTPQNMIPQQVRSILDIARMADPELREAVVKNGGAHQNKIIYVRKNRAGKKPAYRDIFAAYTVREPKKNPDKVSDVRLGFVKFGEQITNEEWDFRVFTASIYLEAAGYKVSIFAVGEKGGEYGPTGTFRSALEFAGVLPEYMRVGFGIPEYQEPVFTGDPNMPF